VRSRSQHAILAIRQVILIFGREAKKVTPAIVNGRQKRTITMPVVAV